MLHTLLSQWYPMAAQIQAALTTVDNVVPLSRAPYVLCNCAKGCHEHTPLIFVGDRGLDDRIRTLSGTVVQRLKGLQMRYYSTKEQWFEATGIAKDGGGLAFNSSRNSRICDRYACYLPAENGDVLERAAKRHRTSRSTVIDTYAK